MARGKAAAQAANRRLADALARIATLEAQLADKEAAHRTETTTLRADLQRAQGVTNRQIKQLSDQRIAEERDRAHAVIQGAADTHLQQVIAGFVKLEEIPSVKIEATIEEHVAIAEAFGVDAGPLMAGIEVAQGRKPRRDLARSTNKASRWKSRILQGVDNGTLTTTPAGAHSPDRWREP